MARRQRAVQTSSDSARAKSSRRLVLLVNPKSGGGSFPRGGVGDGARDVEVVVVGNGEGLAETARGLAAAGVDARGVAGGDGSLAGAANEAVSMTPPMRFTIRPRALRLLISSRHPGTFPLRQGVFAAPWTNTRSECGV